MKRDFTEVHKIVNQVEENLREEVKEMILHIIEENGFFELETDWEFLLGRFYKEKTGKKRNPKPIELLGWIEENKNELTEFFKRWNETYARDRIYYEFLDARGEFRSRLEQESLTMILSTVLMVWYTTHQSILPREMVKTEIKEYSKERIYKGDLRWTSWYKILDDMDCSSDMDNIIEFIESRHKNCK